MALQLEKPWELTHIEFDDQDQDWHLHLDFKRGTVFACPQCGAECKGYDSAIKHWRHLDFWDWKTFMHARMPRVKCTSCNKVTQVYAKWARPLSHFTLFFEAWAMRLMAEMPVNAAARELREHDTRVLGMGDLEFWYRLRRMSEHPDALLEIQGPCAFPVYGTGAAPLLDQCVVALTEAGRDAWAGVQDWVKMKGMDEWYGGLRLHGDLAWRWDSGRKQLVYI